MRRAARTQMLISGHRQRQPPRCLGVRPLSQWARCFRRATPHRRRSAHFVISARVTNVMSGCRPASRAYMDPGSSPLNRSEATSVSRTIGSTGYASSVRRATLGVLEELVQFLFALEDIATLGIFWRSDRLNILTVGGSRQPAPGHVVTTEPDSIDLRSSLRSSPDCSAPVFHIP